MTVVCLMLFVTIGILTGGLSVKKTFEETAISYAPFDGTLMNNPYSDKKEIPAKDALKKLNINIDGNTDYSLIHTYNLEFSIIDLLNKYIDEKTNFMRLNKDLEKTMALKLSEFNNNRRLMGREILELNENEIYVACNISSIKPVVEKYLGENNIIRIGNKDYKIKSKELIKDQIVTLPTNTIHFALIVPDDLLENIEPTSEMINFNFNLENKEEDIKALDKIIDNIEYDKLDFSVIISSKKNTYEESMGVSSMVLFISIYLGIVFLLSSAAVLALQQLSQCNESVDRYIILRKIGDSKKYINRNILIEVSTFFVMPLSLALVHSAIGIKIIQNYLYALGETSSIMYSALITGLIILVVYGGYFYATYIGYKNIICNE